MTGVQTCALPIYTEHSILHFTPQEILDKATAVGVTLGETSQQVSKSINDLLDLEVDRALDIIRNLAAVRPMTDKEISTMGGLNLLCQNLVLEEEFKQSHVAFDDSNITNSHLTDTAKDIHGYMDQEYASDKPKRNSKRRVYPVSAVRRSARFRTAKFFYDEI